MSVQDRLWLLNRIEDNLIRVRCPGQTTIENMTLYREKLLTILDVVENKMDMVATKIEAKLAEEG